MRQECTRDDLPDDLTELEELRMKLSDSLFTLQYKIKVFSNKLGESYNNVLNAGIRRHYAGDSELLFMSNHNDGLLNEFTDLDDRIIRIEYKMNDIKKSMRDS